MRTRSRSFYARPRWPSKKELWFIEVSRPLKRIERDRSAVVIVGGSVVCEIPADIGAGGSGDSDSGGAETCGQHGGAGGGDDEGADVVHHVDSLGGRWLDTHRVARCPCRILATFLAYISPGHRAPGSPGDGHWRCRAWAVAVANSPARFELGGLPRVWMALVSMTT